MTVSSTQSRIGYNGNGTTTVFAFPYRFFESTDLTVTLVLATGTQVTKVLTTDYTVTGAGDEAGGSVTMLVAPASGQQLVIVREVPLTQETDYISGDPFPAETHERALDKLTMISQRLESLISRSIRLSDADLLVTSTILPPPSPGSSLIWNLTGTALVNGVPIDGTLAISPYMEVVLGSVDAAEALTNLTAAADAAVVKLTGAQTVAGIKTFSDSPIVPTPTTDFQASTKEYADTLAPPAGAVMFFAMSTTPTGWLKADGALVSRATYAALFAAIGTTFGVGDGSTTFGLPDLRGEFIRGFDDGKGTDGSRVFGSAQAGQMQSHTHTFNSNGNGNGNSSNYTLGGSEYSVPTVVTVSAAGGTTNSSENRPRNIALLACIKY